MIRFVHWPVLGKFIQIAFFRELEDIAVLALAFCHAHEITLKDLATYGVLQARHSNIAHCHKVHDQI